MPGQEPFIPILVARSLLYAGQILAVLGLAWSAYRLWRYRPGAVASGHDWWQHIIITAVVVGGACIVAGVANGAEF